MLCNIAHFKKIKFHHTHTHTHTQKREVVQLGRIFGLGPRGRRFESCPPDYTHKKFSRYAGLFLVKNFSGCGAVRLAYTSGGRVVAGSNPVIPTLCKAIRNCGWLSFFIIHVTQLLKLQSCMLQITLASRRSIGQSSLQ